MRTLVVSDLHLGTRSGVDVARHAEVRARLVGALEPGDRLVILGDFLELRETAHRDALSAAGPLLAAVGERLGPEGEVLVLAGNHDHGLVGAWMEARLQSWPPPALGLQQHIEPAEAGPLAVGLAAAAAPARLALAYPGVWLRDDVYAIHGHYADLHSTVPTFERLAAGAMGRWVAPLPADRATPADYEAALAPLYAWMHQLVQHAEPGTLRAGAGASARAWVALAGEGRRRRPLRAMALGGAYGAAVSALNRAGLGPLDRSLSGSALRRGTLHGFRESLRRLDVRAPHVIWGHSHRAGPWPGDAPSEWLTHAGGRIHNTGSWVHQRHFLAGTAAGESPYWPGVALVLDAEGPPRLMRLVDELPLAGIATPRLRV